MNKLFTLGLTAFCSSLCFGQTTVKLTTAKAVGESMTLTLNQGVNYSINWGDGTTTSGVSTNETITGTVKGTTITLTGSGLIDLDVSDNALTAISFTDPTDLETLIVSNNQLSVVGISKMTNLRTFWCDGNQLKALGCSQNALLECIVCDNNNITRITRPSNGLSELTDFWAKGNQFETIDLSGSRTLKTLNMEDNQLQSMTLSPLSENAVAVFLDGNTLDFTSFWSKANVGNLYIGDQGEFSFGERSYNIGDWITARNCYGVNADSVNIAPTYTWYSYDEEGTATKLTRGAASTTTGDYAYQDNNNKYVFMFKKPFSDVQLQMTSTRYSGVTIQSEHISIIDPETSIQTTSRENGLTLRSENGSIILHADKTTPVHIYDTNGRLRWSGSVKDSQRIPLGKGLYIINNTKVAL